MDLDEMYRTYKPQLTAYAYRILGTVTDAEDAVQDVFVSVRRHDSALIEHPKAYLMKMVTNRSINLLKSARRQKEVYPGNWLPEPDITLAAAEEPSEQLMLRESFGYALLVLLQELTPGERAVYVLKESLGYAYDEIALMLDKTEAACRKIFSRAKSKLGAFGSAESSPAAKPDAAEPYLQAFAEGARTGQFEPFLRLLTDDAVLIADGGGKVRTAINPILGRERIAAFVAGLFAKGSYAGTFHPIRMSGQPGLLLIRPDKMQALTFGYAEDGSIHSMYIVSNPDKLTHIHGTFR
ncbi:sigma-70 family RNA polymerase sigma factor [Paenibacillus kobensis]|uniref:sigma-70 family RNA polymerase sigma factor n=1 Tax=Paenibacillus kobensis TaxID=59841 RepID=UPI000FD75F16|nr:sigma-70 family RNA polymerase sigma factor [Paenibacillus kobensis]